jgi:hypothetical protein
MESRIGPKHEHQGKEVRAKCQDCDRETTHVICASAEFQSKHSERNFSINFWDEYQAIECKGCQMVSFRHCSRNTENMDHDPDTEEEFLIDTVKLYPEHAAGRTDMRDVELLPPTIQQIYQESLNALNAGMRLLSGIGIRALVETMCKDRKAVGRDLEKKIDDLAAQGVVAREGAEILHGLRIMGNQAAHEVRPHTLEDLRTALDVIEHALIGVYVLPKQAAGLPRREAKEGSSGSAEAVT